MNEIKKTGFIAVHSGAGHHSRAKYLHYNKLNRNACRVGGKILKNGGSALEAVKAAVMVLENDPLTNAGHGSNLTQNGEVEGDASVMNGKTLAYGGCGAVPKVKNPVALAYEICTNQTQALPMGLVQPSLLVGIGGLHYAKKTGLKIVKHKDLISARAQRQFVKYKERLHELSNCEDRKLDTVGAVCIDNSGHVAAASSSGGLLLKRPGRVGQAALYASGVWADSFSPKTETAVAVCTTGCGEQLVSTLLAKEIGADLKDDSCPIIRLHKCMTDKFIRSRYLRNVPNKLGGALVLHVRPQGERSLLWGHSSETMSVGYMNISDCVPKGFVSQLPEEIETGTNITVSGTHFYIN